MPLKRGQRIAAAHGFRPKHTFRVGGMIIKEGTRPWFALQRRRLRKRGKDIGFDSPDVRLSVIKDKKNQYHAAMYVTPENKEIRLHALAHALHLKLYQENGLQVKRFSPIFSFEHDIMELLQSRKIFEWVKKRALPIPMDAMRKPRQFGEDAPIVFAMTLVRTFPTRARLMEAISHFYADPSIKQRILRLNTTEEALSPNDIAAFADFFSKEARKKK